VRRYGQVIGFATREIASGDHVHTQNLGIGELQREYEFCTDVRHVDLYAPEQMRSFDGYRRYCRGIEAMDNNPAPGNKAGGITTVFEKSLGGVTKGGTTPMMDVFQYGEPITTRGFVFMDTPGHDPVSITGLVAGGCNIICFTTGRGSVFGCKPVPSIKLATNSLVYRHLEEDMDINCGVILEGTPVADVGRQIFEEIVAVASGKRTKSELSGVGEEEFAPWIIGPVM
jgi:arabinonate dehydratase